MDGNVCLACDDAAGHSGDYLGGEAETGETEAEEVLGCGEEAGDVEQRIVGDAVAEQRARRPSLLGSKHTPPVQSH